MSSEPKYDIEVPTLSVRQQCDWGSCWAQASVARDEIVFAQENGRATKFPVDFVYYHHIRDSYMEALDQPLEKWEKKGDFNHSLVEEGGHQERYLGILAAHGLVTDRDWKPLVP